VPEILKAAAIEFSKHGFPGARMEDIAARVGVTKPVIYRHFKSKQSLLEALLRQELSTDYSQIADEIRLHRGPLVHILKAIIAGVKQAVPASADGLSAYRLMLADGYRLPSLRRAIQQSALSPVREALKPVFVRAMAQGKMRKADPDFATREVFAPLFQAMMVLTITGLDTWGPRATADYLDHALDSFIRSYEIDA